MSNSTDHLDNSSADDFTDLREINHEILNIERGNPVSESYNDFITCLYENTCDKRTLSDYKPASTEYEKYFENNLASYFDPLLMLFYAAILSRCLFV